MQKTNDDYSIGDTKQPGRLVSLSSAALSVALLFSLCVRVRMFSLRVRNQNQNDIRVVLVSTFSHFLSCFHMPF